MKRTTVIICALTVFLIGLGLSRLRITIALPILFCCMLLTFFSWKISKKAFFLLLMLVSLMTGLYRGGVYMQHIDQYQAVFKQQVTLQANVTEDGVYAEHSQLAFSVDSIKILNPREQSLIGGLRIEGFGVPMVYRGDTVQVSGKIYPTRGGKQGTIKFAQIKIISHQPNIINELRHEFIAGMYNALPEPLASFALGLLIGQRSTLPEAVTLSLAAAGLTHIIAVSGYNLTIIVRAIQKVFAKRSRYQTVLFALGLMCLFVLLAGSSPSIIRASLVSLLSITAWYYGRTIKPLLLILFVAALTAGFNPIYIWADIGWYLSFLAFFGVLILAPLLIKRLFKHKRPKTISLVFIETISAQIMTVPIILYIFGRTSWLSVPANILVVPLVPVAMLLSLIAGMLGTLLPVISGFTALPAKLLLTYMLDVATFFSKLPGVIIERSISWQQMVGMYIVLFLICLVLWHKTKSKHGTITDINSANQEF